MTIDGHENGLLYLAENRQQSNLRNRHFGDFVAISLSLSLIWFAPLLAYCALFATLFLTGKSEGSLGHLAVILVVSLLSALIVSSRAVFDSPSDDFIRYWDLFERLLQGDRTVFREYQNGLEIGLPALYWVYSSLGIRNYRGLLFAQTFTAVVLFGCWVEHQCRRFTSRPRLLVLLSSLFFFGITMSSQLTRQVFSSLFVLYAITAKPTRRYVMLIVAAAFHVSAPVFYAIYKASERLRIPSLVWFFVLSVALRASLPLLVEALDTIPVVSRWLWPFLHSTPASFVNVRAVLDMLVLLIVTGTQRSMGPEHEEISTWNRFIAVIAVTSIPFVANPIVVARTTLLPRFVAFGYILGIALSDRCETWLRRLLALYSVYRLFSMQQTVLWDGFPAWGIQPGYFLL